MTRYSVEPRTRKYVKGYGFLFSAKNLNELRQVALNGILLSKLLNDSTISKFVTKMDWSKWFTMWSILCKQE